MVFHFVNHFFFAYNRVLFRNNIPPDGVQLFVNESFVLVYDYRPSAGKYLPMELNKAERCSGTMR